MCSALRWSSVSDHSEAKTRVGFEYIVFGVGYHRMSGRARVRRGGEVFGHMCG